jgi:hypothetical protein
MNLSVLLSNVNVVLAISAERSATLDEVIQQLVFVRSAEVDEFRAPRFRIDKSGSTPFIKEDVLPQFWTLVPLGTIRVRAERGNVFRCPP